LVSAASHERAPVIQDCTPRALTHGTMCLYVEGKRLVVYISNLVCYIPPLYTSNPALYHCCGHKPSQACNVAAFPIRRTIRRTVSAQLLLCTINCTAKAQPCRGTMSRCLVIVATVGMKLLSLICNTSTNTKTEAHSGSYSGL